MDEKTLQALTALANKLGTTAEYLWGVLLRQAPISGLIDLLVCMAWIACVFAWARFVNRKTTPNGEDRRHSSAEWSDELGVGLAWISVALALFVVMLIVGTQLSSIAAAFFNPEYWALRQILK